MTKSEIIEIASSLTERKGESQLKLDVMVVHAIQKFCAEKRFWWRKKTLTFNTVANQATYDLTSVTTVPASSGLDVEEITQLVYVKSTTEFPPLVPIFDDLAIVQMIHNTSGGTPGIYTMDPNSYQQVRLNLPDAVYTVRMMFWAMPNPASDNSDDSVPLVPRYLHYCIVDRLVMDIYRSLYGPADSKFVTAKAEYQASLDKALAKNSFDASKSAVFKSSEAAIRST